MGPRTALAVRSVVDRMVNTPRIPDNDPADSHMARSDSRLRHPYRLYQRHDEPVHFVNAKLSPPALFEVAIFGCKFDLAK
jgi:hypothetical protein